ncbi:NAD-dependent epimerase/dehydratase family protein [Bradyrhizobium sp.]
MARNALVLGGTSFFGRALVRRLLEGGADVTIATRSTTPDFFGDSVHRQTIDRSDVGHLNRLACLKAWDVVYDQICYSASDAKAACSAFNGSVGRYVLTSSVVVYDRAADREETDFDASGFVEDPQHGLASSATRRYAEGKKGAEAVFCRNARFPFVAVRFPNVLGANDPSRRLEWHVERVKQGAHVFAPDHAVRQSLIWSEDAGRFLAWIGDQTYCGSVNAASMDPVAIGELLEMIAAEAGRAVAYAGAPSNDNLSPFGFGKDFTIKTQLAERLGFRFARASEWLPIVIREHMSSGPLRSRDPGLNDVLAKMHRRQGITDQELDYLRLRIAQLERSSHRLE